MADLHAQRPPRACPHCGKLTDCDTEVYGDGTPEPGNVSVCFYCAGVALFTEDGFRLPTEEERAELLAAPEVTEAVAQILAYRALDG